MPEQQFRVPLFALVFEREQCLRGSPSAAGRRGVRTGGGAQLSPGGGADARRERARLRRKSAQIQRECARIPPKCALILRKCVHILPESVHIRRKCVRILRECVHILRECVRILAESVHILRECEHIFPEIVRVFGECAAPRGPRGPKIAGAARCSARTAQLPPG